MEFRTVDTAADIAEILRLQEQNHLHMVSEAERVADGFVTVRHDADVLARMNAVCPSVVAMYDGMIAGYCLAMPQSFRADLPILEPMFRILEALSFRNEALLNNPHWLVMGQVCVAAPFRGTGVFSGMYDCLAAVCRQRGFRFLITEVSERNGRSLRAHHKIGFETFHRYYDEQNAETWHLIGLPLA